MELNPTIPIIKMNNPVDTWKWFGHAGHLCVAHECRFHLTTLIGDFLISTVGAWHPIVNGKHADEPDRIGHDRLYETMVFKAGEPCTCGCCGGLPNIRGNELLFKAANTAGEANKNHLEYYLKIANGYCPNENE